MKQNNLRKGVWKFKNKEYYSSYIMAGKDRVFQLVPKNGKGQILTKNSPKDALKDGFVMIKRSK